MKPGYTILSSGLKPQFLRQNYRKLKVTQHTRAITADFLRTHACAARMRLKRRPKPEETETASGRKISLQDRKDSLKHKPYDSNFANNFRERSNLPNKPIFLFLLRSFFRVLASDPLRRMLDRGATDCPSWVVGFATPRTLEENVVVVVMMMMMTTMMMMMMIRGLK